MRNSTLVGVTKFIYLKPLLSGVALESIQGLTLSDANYAESVSIPHSRFGNRQRIIDRHMDIESMLSLSYLLVTFLAFVACTTQLKYISGV